jgi:hypothetical protein
MGVLLPLSRLSLKSAEEKKNQRRQKKIFKAKDEARKKSQKTKEVRVAKEGISFLQ